MKKFMALVLALLLVLSMVACGEKTPDTTQNEPSGNGTSAFSWPSIFVVNTTSSTSSAYSQTLAWATVIEKDTGMAVRLLPEDSNNTKFRRVKLGEVNCMYDTITDVANLLEATNGFQTNDGGPFAVRNLMIDNIQTALLVVRGDSTVDTIQDITTSTKIAYWADASMTPVINAIANVVGCTSDDLTLVPCSAYGDMIKMVGDGSADLCPYITPSASSLIEVAAGNKGVKILDFNPALYGDECAKWQEIFPNQSFTPVVSGYEGALGKYGYSNYAGVWTSADQDEELVYNLFKYFMENEAAIVPTYDSFQYYWNLETYADFAATTPIAIHDGVIRYLKEVGVWTDAMQARQDYNVALAEWYTELYQEALADATAQKITVSIDNDAWNELWSQCKEDAGIPIIHMMSDEEIAAADLSH